MYSFNGAGGVSNQLPMKLKKNTKGLSNYPFLFLAKKHQRPKLESAYTAKPQLALSGTKHTVTTPNRKTIHRKNISEPIDFKQEHTATEGTDLRGQDGRFTKSPLKQRRTAIIDSESEPEAEAPLMETESPKAPEPSDHATLKRSTFGRGKPKTTGDRPSPGSSLETPGKIPALDDIMDPLTINTGHMTETEIRQAIQDVKTTEQELFIRAENGKVPINSNMNPKDNLETYDLELASSLSPSTEIEASIITEEEKVFADRRD